MTLSELAFACFCYSRLTDYDSSYLLFRQATQPTPDLSIADHRRALLIWLNQWGCRQFAIDYHDHASGQLLNWHNEFLDQMLPEDKNIWELTEADYQFTRRAYKSLMQRVASVRRRNNTDIQVSFGPTGAAKILFAIRPKAFAPWDDPIRDSLQFDGSPDSYVSFIRQVNQALQGIRPTCEANGFSLVELPAKLGRTHSSPPKLIDEYFWMTIAKNWTTPDRETFRNWAHWTNEN